MKALLKLVRDTYTDKSTIGKLYVNDKFICDTLEDKCRDLNRDGDLKDFVNKDLKHIIEFDRQCKELELQGKKQRNTKKSLFKFQKILLKQTFYNNNHLSVQIIFLFFVQL